MDRRQILKASLSIPRTFVGARYVHADTGEVYYACELGQIDPDSPFHARQISLFLKEDGAEVWLTVDATDEDGGHVASPSYVQLNPHFCKGSDPSLVYLCADLVEAGLFVRNPVYDPKYPASAFAGGFTDAVRDYVGGRFDRALVARAAAAESSGVLSDVFAPFAGGDFQTGFARLVRVLDGALAHPEVIALVAAVAAEHVDDRALPSWQANLPPHLGASWAGERLAAGAVAAMYELCAAVGFVRYVEARPVALQQYACCVWFDRLRAAVHQGRASQGRASQGRADQGRAHQGRASA